MIMLMKVTFLYITYLIYNLLQLHILSLETVVTNSALKSEKSANLEIFTT